MLYVSGSASGDVAAFEVGAGGELKAVDGSPAPSGGGAAGVALAPDGRQLYVSNAAAESVSAFRVAASTGTLSPLPGSPFEAGRGPLDLAGTPDGRRLYVGNLLSNSISAFDVAPDGGGLSPLSGSPFGAGLGPAGVAVSPDGARAYVAGAASREVSGFDVDSGSGALSPLAGSPFPAPGVPLDIALTPDGARLYAAGFSAGVSGFDMDPATGGLSPIAGSPFAAGDGTAAVALAPDGRRLYAANLLSDEVSGFDVDPATGSLTPVEGAPFEVAGGPSGLALTPDGRHLYASSAQSSEIHAFEVTSGTGSLAPVAGSPFAARVRNPGYESLAISPSQPPAASFEVAPAPLQQPTAFDATASRDPDGQVVRYDWDFGDGGKLADGGPTPTYVYRSYDTYTVTLTVTDDGGCSTDMVSTGETLHCNGGARASTQQPVELEQPGLRLRAERVQRAGRAVAVKAMCSKSCTVAVRGTLIVKGAGGGAGGRHAYRLRPSRASLEPGQARTLRLRLTSKARRAAGRALAGGGSARANISAGAVDAVGLTSRPKGRSVKLRGR